MARLSHQRFFLTGSVRYFAQEESPIWAQVASEAFRDSTFGMVDVRILESGRRDIFLAVKRWQLCFFFASKIQKAIKRDHGLKSKSLEELEFHTRKIRFANNLTFFLIRMILLEIQMHRKHRLRSTDWKLVMMPPYFVSV